MEIISLILTCNNSQSSVNGQRVDAAEESCLDSTGNVNISHSTPLPDMVRLEGVIGQIEREDVARTGLLSLLSIATRSEVYVFDLDTIGPSVFKWGLGEVLTNPGCVKVVHDSRMLR